MTKRDWSRLSPRHGHARAGKWSRVYRVWNGMMNRCNNPNNRSYDRYGGRGIKVCERWHRFEDFLADMGEPPTGDHQLERTDNAGNYEPANCRWATRQEQARNRRSSHLIEFRGETKTLAEWCQILGLRHTTVLMRLRNGWSAEKALTTPARNWSPGKKKPPT